MVTIKHKKNVTIPDDPAAASAGMVVSSDWNNVLDFKTAASLILLGRKTAGAGDVEELSASDVRTLLNLVPGLSAGNIIQLDSGGKIDASVLPSIAISEPFEVGSQAAMLALDAQKGDVAIRTDLSKTFILATNSPSTLADWNWMQTPTDVVLAVAGLTGTITAAALKTALAMTAADITDLSANGRSLIKAADYTAMKTLLGLVIGTNVQAFSPILAAIAGLSLAGQDGKVLGVSGGTIALVNGGGNAMNKDPKMLPLHDATQALSNTNGGSESAATTSAFWNTLAAAGAIITTAVSNTYSTVVDITGRGFLFSVVAPALNSASATVGFRITVDGTQYEILSTGPWRSTASNGRVVLGSLDRSTGTNMFTTTGPLQSVANNVSSPKNIIAPDDGGTVRMIGGWFMRQFNMPSVYFENSLKVETKCSALVATSGNYASSGAQYQLIG